MCLPSLGICGIWLDITSLEQPGATCPVGQPVFSSHHKSGCPVADFQRCWCQTFLKKWTFSPLSEPPAPSLVLRFHPVLSAAGVERTQPPGPLWAQWPFTLISGGSSSPISCQSLSPGSPLSQKRRWHLAGNGWLPFYFD